MVHLAEIIKYATNKGGRGGRGVQMSPAANGPSDRNHEKILGCTTVNRLYVTPIGDVLVCPYVHIKIGNIFEQSLKEIIDHGFSIKYFRNHSDLCLAGEDKDFISKFMTKSGQTIFKPALAKDIFSEEDFV